MTLGQRVVSLWLVVLSVIIALVVYLDGGFNAEPIIFFSLLWIIDIIILGFIVLRCLHAYNVFGLADYTTIGSVLPQLTLKPTIYATGSFYQKNTLTLFSAVILSKFVFEILLYIQLRYRSIGVIWIMIPLWTFLGLTSLCLIQKIVEFHQKF
jgi:hypothetical protein